MRLTNGKLLVEQIAKWLDVTAGIAGGMVFLFIKYTVMPHLGY